MKKSEYWEAHCKKNPVFRDEGRVIKITVAQLRRLAEEAYDAGEAEAMGWKTLADILGDIGGLGKL